MSDLTRFQSNGLTLLVHCVCGQEFIRSYAVELEALDREYRQKIKKLEAAYNRHVQEVAENLKVQQVNFN
jgi:hypothetical protein